MAVTLPGLPPEPHEYEAGDGGFCASCGLLPRAVEHFATAAERVAEGKRRRDEALRVADAAADPAWRDAALYVVRALAESRSSFTADDVQDGLDVAGVSTSEPRALGAVMTRAKNVGWITPTDDFVASRRPEAHAGPKRVWRSTIEGDEG